MTPTLAESDSNDINFFPKTQSINTKNFNTRICAKRIIESNEEIKEAKHQGKPQKKISYPEKKAHCKETIDDNSQFSIVRNQIIEINNKEEESVVKKNTDATGIEISVPRSKGKVQQERLFQDSTSTKNLRPRLSPHSDLSLSKTIQNSNRSIPIKPIINEPNSHPSSTKNIVISNKHSNNSRHMSEKLRTKFINFQKIY